MAPKTRSLKRKVRNAPSRNITVVDVNRVWSQPLSNLLHKPKLGYAFCDIGKAMAFLSKLGNILKQTPSKQLNGQAYLSSPRLFQAIRCMSSCKLCVEGIGYSMNVKNLREAFSKYGEVIQVRIIVDRVTGRSRGFGFVTFISEEESSRALKALNGRVLHGRVLKLDYATNRNSDGFAEAFCSMLRSMNKYYKENPVFTSSSQKGVEE